MRTVKAASISVLAWTHRALTGSLLLLACLAVSPAKAERILLRDLVNGVTMTQAQCAALPEAVWVKAMGRQLCIRYYLSKAGGSGARAMVFLQGDKLGKLYASWRFQSPEPDAFIETDNLKRLADSMSRQSKTTAIYLARIGVDGSSGHHRARKSVLELHVINAALDAIKARHKLEGFHLVGQSGGATLVGGLLGLRNDIACAVPGAGKLARIKPVGHSSNPERQYFDPSASFAAIVRNGSARILVVTDPADERVNVEHQVAFVRGLRAAGGQVEQLFVQAIDKSRHGVSVYAVHAAASCVLGKSNEEIARSVAKLVERRVTAAEQRAADDAKQAKAR